MYKNLIEEARSEGMEGIAISVIVQNMKGQILLIEDLNGEKSVYELPSTYLKEEETIPQALQRAVTESTAMELKEVMAYLGHYDQEKTRYYHFIAEVKDPYAVEENTKIAYAWLGVQEAVGYPIRDNLREMLDLYARFEEQL